MDAPPPVTLVTGAEDLLVERAVAAVLEASRAADPATTVNRVEPGELTAGALAEWTSPSLFGERSVLVIERAHELTGDAAAVLAAYIADPAPDAAVVVLHAGAANRAKAVLAACQAATVPTLACAAVTRAGDRLDFVRAEVRAAGRTIPDDAARVLVDAVGGDLRSLASAVAQLVADSDGPLTPALVARYYAGRAEVTSFAVADLTMEGRTPEALAQARQALAAGVAPVLLTSALASGLRTLARVGYAPRGVSGADVARLAGVPPWKVDVARRQLRGWDGDGLAAALSAVADADAAVKGMYGALDPGFVIERAVTQVIACRRS